MNQRKQALVRETIWEAAIDLFAQKGFDETTVDDIAIAAGTSRPSVFRYFKSKSDFIALPIVSYGTFLIDALQSCPLTDSPANILRHTLLAVAKNSAANPRTKKVMEIAARYPEANQAQLARLAEVQGEVIAALSKRFRRNARERTMARVLAASVLFLLGITFHTWFESGQGDITAVVDQVLASLCEVACTTKSTRTPAAKKTEVSTHA